MTLVWGLRNYDLSHTFFKGNFYNFVQTLFLGRLSKSTFLFPEKKVMTGARKGSLSIDPSYAWCIFCSKQKKNSRRSQELQYCSSKLPLWPWHADWNDFCRHFSRNAKTWVGFWSWVRSLDSTRDKEASRTMSNAHNVLLFASLQ